VITAIRKRLEQREEGFTLIELLVVVIIIGILAAVAIPTFLNQRQRAFRAAVQSDLRNAAVEAETFYTDNSTYLGFEDEVPDLRTSPDVTLTAGTTAFSSSAYCIQGAHSSLGATETYIVQPGNVLVTGTCS